ncbi:MAG: MmyB family transcriptional regulator [Vulcanimicrobiaceae bacterium]
MKALSFPAYIITATWDVIDCNEAFRRVWAVGERELPFNAIERLFLEPAARRMHGERLAANVTPVRSPCAAESLRCPQDLPGDCACLVHHRQAACNER